MLKRKAYDKLLDWKNTKSKKCLMIKGARQVGKTDEKITLPHYMVMFI